MEKKVFNLKLTGHEEGNESPRLDGRLRSGYREPNFLLVVPVGKDTLQSITSSIFCRESLCEVIRQDIRGLKQYSVDRKKLRLLIKRRIPTTKKNLGRNREVFEAQIAAGLKIVNTIEKRLGWPLTKAYPTKTTVKVSDNVLYYYLVGSVKWWKAPAMLSLFTLLFRVAVNEKKFGFQKNITSYKKLWEVLQNFSSVSRYIESAYTREHLWTWKLILENYNRLFKGRKIEDLYFPEETYLFQEGINTLCDVQTNDAELKKRMEKLVEEYKE